MQKTKEEPIEVVAEVVEPDHVELVPAKIDAGAYLAAKKAWLDGIMEPYRNVTKADLAKMNTKEVKACRADLNRIIKEVDGERKAIKRAYSEPLEKFEEAVRQMLAEATQAEAALGEIVNEQAAAEKALLREGLERTYNDYAPALVPVVPFERILATNPKWLNKSYGAAKAANELCDVVDRIAREWDVLQSMRPLMRFYDEAEAVYFRTLDLSAAKEHNAAREAEAAHIEQLKKDVAAVDDKPAQEQNASGYVDLATGEIVDELPRKMYKFSAMLNTRELESLREWKNACGVGTDWRFMEVKNG